MWKCYKVYLEAKAPIHIGYGAKLGIVNRTRYYIPAKNIWGALTNLIAKSIMESYNPEIYRKVGEWLNKNVKFSYFYPAKYIKDKEEMEIRQIFAPCYTDYGLRFGLYENKEQISLEEFERAFISSFISTAVDKTSKSAEEGALHEIEFIKDKVECDGEIKPTVFMGYFFIKNNRSKIKLNEEEVEILFGNEFIEVNEVKLNEIWIGGERNYGFGRMKISFERCNKNEIDLFNSGINVNLTEESLKITSEGEGITVLSHLNIENLNVKMVRGDIEPLIGREWDERGSGQKVSPTAKICVVPGSQVVYKGDLTIGNFGIWE